MVSVKSTTFKMFCSSLRKRQEWSAAPSALLQSKSQRWMGILAGDCRNLKSVWLTQWLEKTLTGCDIILPLPKTPHDPSKDSFRFLLLSASDSSSASGYMDRIERLYHQKGGRDVGIVFLLQEKPGKDSGMLALMELQSRWETAHFFAPRDSLYSASHPPSKCQLFPL